METNDPNQLPPNQFTGLPEKPAENKKMAAGLCAILLGSLGVHKFVLGYNVEGAIMLAVTLIGYATMCFFIGFLFFWIPGVIALIEGIIYLTKTDEEFYETYQKNKRAWF